ncbi:MULTISPECIES: DUF5326 family protein [unclassified Streptomyces]|uniref:DUF5326 family protein n=1 Tax=unclassified Streptomyces TaxID=2593676 RepID=UPI0016600F6C|nr:MULTISPECIES: DUF5326 family protein [unclassified Streptomyces]MBD0708551.1 hypothetical protein [Streptomyces sp. CBMA291]MBD0712848.1 hypothetical protein [Streptomyces sp. CBMA370]
MAVQQILAGMPWWVKWVAIPALVLLVFGGLITSVLTFVISLVFKVLLFVALVAGLIYVVRRFSSGRSREDW